MGWLILGSCCAARAATPASQRGQICHMPGAEEALRCFAVPVPFDPARPAAGTLALHVTLAPAFRESAKADPLFVLAGGPGQAGGDLLPLLNGAFRRVRATRDIVFIDQRGTGLSGRLDCPDGDPDQAPDEERLQQALTRCAATLRHPLSLYHTAHAARDLEQVRLALGYGAINLWGGSYGTRLAQAYARAYPASVRAMVLDGVAAPDQIIPAGARDGQAALDALFARCAADPACAKAFPRLKEEFGALLRRVDGGAVTLDFPHPRTAQATHLALSNRKFVETVHGVLYSANDSGRLPFLIHNAFLGNWAPLMVRAYAGGDLGAEGPVSVLLHLAVVCAEDVPRLSAQAYADDDRGAFMAGYARRIASLCPALAVPAVMTAPPGAIAAPALLLSGAMDPVTPPRRADDAARFLPRSQRFVVRNAGHGISQLGCAPRLLREFLDRPERPLAADCLNEIAPTVFQLGNAGARP